VPGLIRAIESKYKINARNIRYLYKKNKEGALVKLDDDMIKYYCNEDIFLMQVTVTGAALLLLFYGPTRYRLGQG
jgi:transcription factor CP2-like protein